MSSNSKGGNAIIFILYTVFFCLTNWLIWMHYLTIQGPTALASVIETEHSVNRLTHSYYLTIRYAQADLKAANSRLEISKQYYTDFAPGDKFPIKYAEDFPNETAFVGEQLFSKRGVVEYGVLVLILVFSFPGVRRELGLFRRPNQPSPGGPSARAALLMWALLGVAAFGGGIISCRQASSDAAVARKMLAYEQRPATLLGTRYTPATNRISALVRLPEASNDVPIRVALTPEQHALLYARLTRLQPQNRQVLVACFLPMPEQVLLVDAALQRLFTTGGDTSPVISYNTLGLILCSVGIVLAVMYLTKYFNLTKA